MMKNIPINKAGKIPSPMLKKIISIIPVPFERGFLGEFNTGKILNIPSKLTKFIVKINSKMT
jgi:hypothetical protein